MQSESNGDLQKIEERATAFVFGELDREQATEFMRQMDASPLVREMVESIRGAVGALESEFSVNTPTVTPEDRMRIHAAMREANTSQPFESSSQSVSETEAESRRWLIGLATAAALLLACGLTLPALNRAIATNSKTAKMEERIRLIEAENRRLELENQQVVKTLAEERRIFSLPSEGTGSLETGSREMGDQESGSPGVVLAETGSGLGGEQRSEEGQHEQGQGEQGQGEQGQGDPKPGGLMSGSESGSPAAGVANSGSAESENRDGPGDASDGGQGLATNAANFASQPGDDPGAADVIREMDESSMTELGGYAEESMPADIALSDMDMDMEMSGPGMMEDMEMGMEMDDVAMGPMDGRGGMRRRLGTEMRVPALGQRMGGAVNTNGVNTNFTKGRAKAKDSGAMMGFGGMAMGGQDAKGFGGDSFGFVIDSGDRFEGIQDNPFKAVGTSPLSTFAIDVDTASYSKLRMYLMQHNRFPGPNAVRIEELVNYFDYHYPEPLDEHPVAAAMDIASCPWNGKHRLARIGIKGKEIQTQRPSSNLVFLLDVSGSMNQPNKLPLVVGGLKMLVDQLDENDSVAIVVYAGAAGLVLDSTNGDSKSAIVNALDRLRAGGSTNGGEGIQLAYSVARDHFIVGGTNRVILCSDGDFNVGVTGTNALVDLATENAKGGIFLSVLGFGMGNHNDAMMERVSNQANGNYAFIDTRQEARKVLVKQMQGTLVTVAKDVKIQVEFNPMEVQAYRLIGYENRVMANRDFDDDTKDGGEIGAGHTVTALYEIIPTSEAENANEGEKLGELIAPLKYQRPKKFSDEADNGEMLTLKMRYKLSDEGESTLIQFPATDTGKGLNQADRDFQFAASVAAFGMLLRDSPHKGQSNYSMVEELAIAGADDDQSGYRDEFVTLVRRARHVAGKSN